MAYDKPFETKEGTGTLFQNDQRGNDKAPTHKGTCRINGMMYEIAGWQKVSQAKGTRYLSLIIKPVQAQGARTVKVEPRRMDTPRDDFEPDSEIPF